MNTRTYGVKTVGGGGGGGSSFTLLIVGASNTIYSALYDLKGLKNGPTITSLPSPSPASLITTADDGLCAAQIVGTSTLVWIANRVDNGLGIFSDALFTIPEGQVVACRKRVPLDGSSVFLPWRV